MPKFNIQVEARFKGIEAKDRDEAVEMAADYARQYKPGDFEYNVWQVPAVVAGIIVKDES